MLSEQAWRALWESLPVQTRKEFLQVERRAAQPLLKGLRANAEGMKDPVFLSRLLHAVAKDEVFGSHLTLLWTTCYAPLVKSILEAPPESVFQAALSVASAQPEHLAHVQLALELRGDASALASLAELPHALWTPGAPLPSQAPSVVEERQVAPPAAESGETRSLQRQLRGLESRLEDLRGTLRAVESERDHLRGELEEKQALADQLAAKCKQAKDSNDDLRGKLREADHRKEQLEGFFTRLTRELGSLYAPFGLSVSEGETSPVPRTEAESEQPPPVEKSLPLELTSELLDESFEHLELFLARLDGALQSGSPKALERVKQELETPVGELALRQLKEEGSPLVRVLLGQARGLIIDASNVAHSAKQAKARVDYIESAREAALAAGFFPIEVIADAALRHKVDDREAYDRLVNRRLLREAPARTDADVLIALEAAQKDFDILSNDKKLHGEQGLPATITVYGFKPGAEGISISRPKIPKRK